MMGREDLGELYYCYKTCRYAGDRDVLCGPPVRKPSAAVSREGRRGGEGDGRWCLRSSPHVRCACASPRLPIRASWQRWRPPWRSGTGPSPSTPTSSSAIPMYFRCARRRWCVKGRMQAQHERYPGPTGFPREARGGSLPVRWPHSRAGGPAPTRGWVPRTTAQAGQGRHERRLSRRVKQIGQLLTPRCGARGSSGRRRGCGAGSGQGREGRRSRWPRGRRRGGGGGPRGGGGRAGDPGGRWPCGRRGGRSGRRRAGRGRRGPELSAVGGGHGVQTEALEGLRVCWRSINDHLPGRSRRGRGGGGGRPGPSEGARRPGGRGAGRGRGRGWSASCGS
jgi:hypothetical protein